MQKVHVSIINGWEEFYFNLPILLVSLINQKARTFWDFSEARKQLSRVTSAMLRMKRLLKLSKKDSDFWIIPNTLWLIFELQSEDLMEN